MRERDNVRFDHFDNQEMYLEITHALPCIKVYECIDYMRCSV